jgi:uncharacterized membrane protein
MLNVAIITLLLVVPYAVAHVLGLNEMIAGRVGIAAVFAFTALGHFAKADAMIPMLPSWMPWRRAMIYASGILEILFVVALLAGFSLFGVGLSIIAYLILIFPSNIHAAVERIPFGGHSMGLRYLLVRLPVQVLLICWVYWFTVRGY